MMTGEQFDWKEQLRQPCCYCWSSWK